MRKIAIAAICIFVSAIPAIAGDGYPPPKSMDVSVNPLQNVVPNVSVPPQIMDPNTRLVLPPCLGEIKNDCIISVEYSTENGKWSKGEFKESMPLKNLTWKSDSNKQDFSLNSEVVFAKPIPEQNFPAGGRTSVWQLPGAKHSKSDLYAVNVDFSGVVSDRTNPRASSTKIKWSDDLRILFGTYNKEEANTGRSCFSSFSEAIFTCEFINIDKFPTTTKFRIKINFLKTQSILDNSPWLIGHIINSRINLSINSDGSRTLSLEGSPTSSGMVTAEFTKSENSYQIYRQALETLHKLYVGDKYPFFYSYEDFINSQGGMGIGPSTPGIVESWNVIEKLAPFTYVNEEDSWLVQNTKVSPSDTELLGRCSTGNFLSGLIATNAIGANPRPPIYDPVTQELIYSVASPHLKKNGSLNTGLYEISIDQKFAECLWGKDSLKYQATIKVISLDGEQKVSTINVAARDGFITFRAAGFTYSANTVRIKLEKSSLSNQTDTELPDYVFAPDTLEIYSAKGKVSPDSTPTPLVPQKSTIICTKGKLSKKITAVKPTCPTGYKMK